MPYLLEALLFLLPFGGFLLWRRFNPGAGIGARAGLLAILGVACAMAGALWYGFSRNMERGTVYVPHRLENGRIVPGHAEPAPPTRAPPPAR